MTTERTLTKSTEIPRLPDAHYLEEPPIVFGFNQSTTDPRDGLTLFGPLDVGKPDGIQWGIVGPPGALGRVKRWLTRMQSPVISGDNLVARPIFPGFEAAFGTRLSSKPLCEYLLDEVALHECAHQLDQHQRVYDTVDLYATAIQTHHEREESQPDVWCIAIPEYVYTYGRPNSRVPSDEVTRREKSVSKNYVRDLVDRPSMFAEENAVAADLADKYEYEVNFHNQLKARVLNFKTPTQVVRESTIAHREFLKSNGLPKRPLAPLESAIAWNLATALFYKAGGRPWKLATAREGVCYVGLAFKQVENSKDTRTACCAAQMFLDSGDGTVFRGATGPWLREDTGVYHLHFKAAKHLVSMCVAEYRRLNGGNAPKELFIHGKNRFLDEEMSGFAAGAPEETQVVGVYIRPVSTLKLFRWGKKPILRGTWFQLTEQKAYVWTRGMVPRIRTYAGREVPNPILVEICGGTADLSTVVSDILALTKLNYNSCVFGDGLPVTVKFADAVGEILTAGPLDKLTRPPLPFKYYI